MGISLEQKEGEWYSSLPQRGGVYDLISTAEYGNTLTERLRATVALGKSGDPRAVRPMVDLLIDPEPQIRLAAAAALGSLRSGRAVDELISRLRDRYEQKEVRQQAGIALTAIRSTGALRGLREFTDDESEDVAIRSFAADLLRQTGAP